MAVLVATWVVLRIATRDMPLEGPRELPGILVAWPILLWPAATTTMVLWVAGVEGPGAMRRAWVGWAWVASAAGLVLLAVAWDSGRLAVEDALKVCLLLAAWLACWVAVGDHLRRWGPGAAVAGSLLVGTLLLAGPVTFVPVFRATPVARQTQVVNLMADACPVLGTLDAIKGSGSFAWEQQQPLMYHLTMLGQDIAKPDVAWWVGAAAAGGLALLLGLAAWRYRGVR